MSQVIGENLRVVRDYHQRTKHRPDRYAAALGYLDWASQPDSFRSFDGTAQIDLPHPQLRETPTYDGLYSQCPEPARLDADLVGRLFYHSLALSAWKQAPHTRPWSLRVNPSSGALHPTEGYLICGLITGLIDQPGVFHYTPLRHGLERRGRLSAAQWQTLTEGLPDTCLLIGLTSIYWRESWKYGERAFRYCHLDVGHALAAITYAARTLGWEVRLLDTVAVADLSRLLGTDLQSGIEAEHADALLMLFPGDAGDAARMKPTIPMFSAEAWHARMPEVACAGEPNRLSQAHHDWPVIGEVSTAVCAALVEQGRHAPATGAAPAGLIPERSPAAERIIRQRRSAVAMDGVSALDRAVFYQLLQRTLPTQFPFIGLPWAPRVALAIFAHRIEGLEPGLYLLVRDVSHEAALRKTLSAEFEWRTPEGCPSGLRLFRMMSGDLRQRAQAISCHQDIASDGAFSLGMLAEFEGALVAAGAACYPRLFWECGLIGQLLYLEAEAAGMRGTGIGCFFDDVMHELLGITDRSWQSLYHFTVGGPMEDGRIKTIPPYAHLTSNG